MEPKEMTVKDILKDVLNILNEINVPMREIETIGIPLGRAINGIQICYQAHERAEQEEAEKAKQEEHKEPELHLVGNQEESDA